MKINRKLLSLLLALAIMSGSILPWMQITVLAQEIQTNVLAIEDKKLYDDLKSCFGPGKFDNYKAMTANDDENQTITLDMQKVKLIEIRNVDMRQENSEEILQTLIRGCTNLKGLKLKGCNLSEFDFSFLDHKESLESLSLADGKLGEVPDIILPNLQMICLAKNDLSADGACNCLTEDRFPNLNSLWLDDCGISDISFLEHTGDLQTLYLGDNRLTDESLAALIDLSSENLSGLEDLNLGKTIHDGLSTSLPNFRSGNKFTDLASLASLPACFPALGNLDLSYLMIDSLQEFASVRDGVKIDFKRNKICDFTGFTSGKNFDLTYQDISLSGDFVEGKERELPELLQRILDQDDVLAGTLSYTNCGLTEEGMGIIIEKGADTAYVQVNNGKLYSSKIHFDFKRIPGYTVPQDLTATVGDTLAKVALPAGFTWKDASLPVGEEGTNIFQAIYTPKDLERYVVVDDIDVPVTVKAPVTEPEDPPKPPEQTDPTEPEDPPKPPEQTDPTEPEDPPKPPEQTDPTEPEDPPEQTDPKDPPEQTDPKDPPKPPVEQTKPIIPTKPTEQEKAEREKRELTFNANLKVKLKGNNIHISWGRVPGADGYDVYVQYCYKRFSAKSITPVKNGKTTKVIVKKINGKKLDLKKFCKVYVRAYKQTDNKKETLAKTITAHVVGTRNTEYTNVKAIKLKKSSFTLKKGKSAVIKARTELVSKGKRQLTDKHAKQFRYASTDKKVATVSAKGKIKAVGKGSCTVYVYARNGYAKKVNVKVK